MEFGGVILGGGYSRRMGRPKATLPFGSETMLGRVARILSEVVQPIAVVLASDQAVPSLDVEVIVVRDRKQGVGPLEGMAVGLLALKETSDAAYVTSCDVPLLAPAFVRRLTELIGEHDIVVPVEDRFHHPLAAVYRTDIVDVIEQSLAEKQRRPAILFDRVNTRRMPVDALREVDPQLLSLANVNRPEDYLRAIKTAGFDPEKGTHLFSDRARLSK